MRLSRATLRWLLLLSLVVMAVSLPSRAIAQATVQPVAFLLCRANVSPCQTELSVPVGGNVDIDLVLAIDSSVQPVVAWETHYQLSDTNVAEAALDATSGQPVREGGEPDLALEGLTPVGISSISTSGHYYTIQNSYDPSTGLLDYSVTLVGQNTSMPLPAIPTGSSQATVITGRVAIIGLSDGTSDLLVVNSPQTSQQLVTRLPSGQLTPTSISGTGAPTTITVGPLTTPTVEGKLAQRSSGGGIGSTPYPSQLSISFWRPGAVPTWQGGADKPIASYQGISTDSKGDFQVDDVAPSIVPPGVYDLRVNAEGRLARVLRGVAISTTGASQPVTSIQLPYLLPGDLDGTNTVDSGDVQMLQNGFGQADSGSGFPSSADLNADGIVDVQDFSLLSRNFSTIGE